jgi:DNA-binding beta-propeller fold protein YncE
MARLANGLVVVSDILSHDVRLFDPATGDFTPLAGVSGCPGFADGTGADARFNRPYGLAVTASGDVLVADQHNHRIRSISIPGGVVTTIAGDGTSDHVDGLIADARFSEPVDLAIDASGAVFVTEIGNHRIRRIAGDLVETVAGGPAQGFADGDGEAARFNGQEGIAVSADGATIVIADGTLGVPGPFHRIRRIVIPQ